MSRAEKLKVTQVRSRIGRLATHKACLTGLGLRRVGHSVMVEDTPSVRGMINKVSYMLKVEEG
ncbi:MAG: 50S ribosomal protein L30 [Gammaproteobacteria bacterium]|nr:MAG: 50S ribosomal protein L30 [Gammaproteobacteria bacterium]RLA54577.1 MAG: 50S ribosomal protein L30 [Gammaproteobacteria bacterium]